mmetsp:Transcript_507/g.1189  ORF Transcript_507/g.1189 Transcript_507/m.1189 type:complete len:210 (-) Transcript_507:926-1555(-)
MDSARTDDSTPSLPHVDCNSAVMAWHESVRLCCSYVALKIAYCSRASSAALFASFLSCIAFAMTSSFSARAFFKDASSAVMATFSWRKLFSMSVTSSSPSTRMRRSWSSFVSAWVLSLYDSSSFSMLFKELSFRCASASDRFRFISESAYAEYASSKDVRSTGAVISPILPRTCSSCWILDFCSPGNPLRNRSNSALRTSILNSMSATA